jgi:hypothetical protein
VLEANQSYYVDFQINESPVLPKIYGNGAFDGDIDASGSFGILGRTYIAGADSANGVFPLKSEDAFPQMYIDVISPDNTNTTADFESKDPSAMLRQIMDIYKTEGGSIIYDDNSIPLSNTVTSYEFKNYNVHDAIKKILELAPVDWFFYVNQAENKLYFKPKNNTPDHRFELGKHMRQLKFEKRSRDVVNIVYFTGGLISDDENLFRKYISQSSIDQFGPRVLQYVDNRVKKISTADTISNNILGKRNYPEMRTSPQVLSNYDISSVKVGDIVTFRNFAGKMGLWDVDEWADTTDDPDDLYWDFNIANPSTFDLQIAKLNYNNDYISLVLSTTPPDINKRIEDINRNLQDQQTINNPDEPS